jgi:hypothetical protein
MSYYSALSRSATAAGTVIIQGFDSKVITRGCSGYLRQEFHELELLDDITRLRFERQLPNHIDAKLRSPVICQFKAWKGSDYVPPKTDAALKWSLNDPMQIYPENHDCSWQIVDRSKRSKKEVSATAFVSAKGTISITPKRKNTVATDVSSPSKRPRTVTTSLVVSPAGIT